MGYRGSIVGTTLFFFTAGGLQGYHGVETDHRERFGVPKRFKQKKKRRRENKNNREATQQRHKLKTHLVYNHIHTKQRTTLPSPNNNDPIVEHASNRGSYPYRTPTRPLPAPTRPLPTGAERTLQNSVRPYCKTRLHGVWSDREHRKCIECSTQRYT